jgi:hypothetical protein
LWKNIYKKNKMSTTYICGYWHVPENVKHSYEDHYRRLLPELFETLRGRNIIFFYSDPSVLEAVPNRATIGVRQLATDSLPTYGLTADYVRSAAAQDTDLLRQKYNPRQEKGVRHYEREYLDSGPHSFRRVLAIWTSKVLLVGRIIQENPFQTSEFAWVDASLTRFGRNPGLYTQPLVDDTRLHHCADNTMTYHGRVLPLVACYLRGHTAVWSRLLPLYEAALTQHKHDPYAHDEETLLCTIRAKHADLFQAVY